VVVLQPWESIVLGLLGSLVHLGLCAYEARAVPGRWEAFGHLMLGPVVGWIFWQTGVPNHLNAFFAGFFALDFLRMISRVYKPSPPKEADEGWTRASKLILRRDILDEVRRWSKRRWTHKS